jgi:acetyl esterase/lipase
MIWPKTFSFVLTGLLLSSFLLVEQTSAVAAEGPEPIPLWEKGAPGAKGTAPEDIPVIRIYPAPEDKNTGACVVILPGGGYGRLAMDHEGHQIATWLNSLGVTGAIVSYRLGPKYNHPAPMQDAQRGIRYMRAHAEKYKIDPNRIGIMGFSAGGHLASTVSTHFDSGEDSSDDPIARQGSRPDFSILCYPVISFQSPFTHKGSRRNLLGENPSQDLIENLSNETQVTKETPPTFIFHTDEDKGVPAENAIVYYQALRKNGVPAELHIYQKGPHGVGLAPGNPVLSTWKERLADWLKINGFLTTAKQASVSGEIRLDDKPLTWGTITFIPKDDANAPIAFAMVSNGKFALNQQDGPALGNNSVTIYSLGAVEFEPTQPDARLLVGDNIKMAVGIQSGTNIVHFVTQSK